MRRNSPRTGRPSMSRDIFCERSPRATAVMTRATSLVGATRSPMSWFTASMLAAQEPFAGPTEARSVMRPSCPTMRPTRSSSFAMWSVMPRMSFSTSAARLSTPSRRYGSRTVKSPAFTALRTSTSCSTSSWVVRERRSHSVSASGGGRGRAPLRARTGGAPAPARSPAAAPRARAARAADGGGATARRGGGGLARFMTRSEGCRVPSALPARRGRAGGPMWRRPPRRPRISSRGRALRKPSNEATTPRGSLP